MSGEELRALAEAATPGEWRGLTFYANRGEVILHEDDPDEEAYPVVVARTETPADAAFIAAANPTAVLALLDERDALRAQVERVAAVLAAPGWHPRHVADEGCHICMFHGQINAALDGPQ